MPQQISALWLFWRLLFAYILINAAEGGLSSIVNGARAVTCQTIIETLRAGVVFSCFVTWIVVKWHKLQGD